MVFSAEILKVCNYFVEIEILNYLPLPQDTSTVDIRLMIDIVYDRHMSGNLRKIRERKVKSARTVLVGENGGGRVPKHDQRAVFLMNRLSSGFRLVCF